MQNFELVEAERGEEGKRPKAKDKPATGIKYYTTARADIKETENLFLSPLYPIQRRPLTSLLTSRH